MTRRLTANSVRLFSWRLYRRCNETGCTRWKTLSVNSRKKEFAFSYPYNFLYTLGQGLDVTDESWSGMERNSARLKPEGAIPINQNLTVPV